MKLLDVLIVGAGPTGIGAAWACEREKADYRLVESADVVGGFSGTVEANGYRWDLGGHVIHSHFADFDRAIKASGVRTVDVRRTGCVLVGEGSFVLTPIQQQLDELPADISPGLPADNLAQYFQNEMGQALYTSFFQPFNEKMWAHPLVEMDHAWTSHRSGSVQANVPRVGLRRPVGPSESFPYPEHGSGSIWESVSAGLDPRRSSFGMRLVGLDLSGHEAFFADGSAIRYRQMVSTIPLDQLCRMAGDRICLDHIDKLVSTRVAVIGFGFRGTVPDALADKTYIYSASVDTPWYRATMLSNYSSAMAPAGCWSILFECSTSDRHRPIDMAAATMGCEKSLVALGIDLRDRDRGWSRLLDYGYPVPVLGRDAALRGIHAHLEAHEVFSRGRFGGWRYESSNQDHSFAQGAEAVTTHGDTVLWRPETFPATRRS